MTHDKWEDGYTTRQVAVFTALSMYSLLLEPEIFAESSDVLLRTCLNLAFPPSPPKASDKAVDTSGRIRLNLAMSAAKDLFAEVFHVPMGDDVERVRRHEVDENGNVAKTAILIEDPENHGSRSNRIIQVANNYGPLVCQVVMTAATKITTALTSDCCSLTLKGVK